MVKHHALVDGNERLGWLATATFLELNGAPVTRAAANDDVYTFVMQAASGRAEVDDLSAGLRALCAE